MKRMVALLLTVVFCVGVSGMALASVVNPQQSGHIAYLDAVYGEGEGARIRETTYGFGSSPQTAIDPSISPEAYPPGWDGAGWVVPAGPNNPQVPTHVVNPATPINGIYYPIGWNLDLDPAPYIVTTPSGVYAPYVYYRLTGTVDDVLSHTIYHPIFNAIWEINGHINANWDEDIYGSFSTRYKQHYGITVAQDIRATSGHHERITAEKLREVYDRVDAVLTGK